MLDPSYFLRSPEEKLENYYSGENIEDHCSMANDLYGYL